MTMVAAIILSSVLSSLAEPQKAETAAIPSEGGFTFEATFRHDGYFEPDGRWPTGLLACYRSGYFDGWRIYLHGPDEHLLFQIGVPEGAGEATSLDGGVPVPRGTWHRLAATWLEEADGKGAMKLYLDGEFCGAKHGVGAPSVNPGETLIAGAAGYGLGAAKLEIAEIEYSASPLDGGQIAARFAADGLCRSNPAAEPDPLFVQVYTRALKMLEGTEGRAEAPAYPEERESVDGFAGDYDGDDIVQLMMFAGGSLVRRRWPADDGIYADISMEDGVFRFSDPGAPEFPAGTRLFAHGYWQYYWMDQILPVEATPDGGFRPLATHMYGFGKTGRAALMAKEGTADATSIPKRRAQLKWFSGVKGMTIRNTEFHDSLGAGIEFADSEDVTIENCAFRRLGRDGIILRNCRGVTIRDCVFEDIGQTAVFAEGCGDRDTLESGRTIIERCRFERTGRVKRCYSPGIYIRGCGNVVRNCVFRDIPSSGMRVEGNDIVVRDCLFENCVNESDDQGCVDTWGDPSFRNCVYFRNVFRGIGGKGTCNCGRAGIRFDDMISGMAVISNVFDRCCEKNFGGVQIHAGHYNAVVGNVFIGGDRMISVQNWGERRWIESVDSPETKARSRNLESSGLYLERYPELRKLRENVAMQYFEGNRHFE